MTVAAAAPTTAPWLSVQKQRSTESANSPSATQHADLPVHLHIPPFVTYLFTPLPTTVCHQKHVLKNISAENGSPVHELMSRVMQR